MRAYCTSIPAFTTPCLCRVVTMIWASFSQAIVYWPWASRRRRLQLVGWGSFRSRRIYRSPYSFLTARQSVSQPVGVRWPSPIYLTTLSRSFWGERKITSVKRNPFIIMIIKHLTGYEWSFSTEVSIGTLNADAHTVALQVKVKGLSCLCSAENAHTTSRTPAVDDGEWSTRMICAWQI